MPTDSDLDAPAPRPARPPAKSSPLRFVSPGTFGAAILLFFLPWTQVTCNGPTGAAQLATQTGFEAALGDVSPGAELVRLRELDEAQGGAKGPAANPMGMRLPAAGKKERTKPAHILWGYAGLLALGAVGPVWVAKRRDRGMAVLLLAGLALGVLGVLMASGFPLDTAVAEQQPGAKKTMVFSYLPSFWGSVAVLVAALAVGVLEVAGAKPAPRPLARRRATDSA